MSKAFILAAISQDDRLNDVIDYIIDVYSTREAAYGYLESCAEGREIVEEQRDQKTIYYVPTRYVDVIYPDCWCILEYEIKDKSDDRYAI